MNSILNPIKSTQAAYDRIKAYFSKPGAVIARSEVSGGCMYRTAEGRKCAVGCLIPDELYSTVYEDTNVKGVLNGGDDWNGWLSETDDHHPIKVDEAHLLEGLQDYFGNVDKDFLEIVQMLHDGTVGDSAKPFVRALEGKAVEFGLTP